MIKYKLFIDDERHPIGDDWVIVRSYIEARTVIKILGLPKFVSFDHDLGDKEKTGMDIAKFIVDYCLDNKIEDKIEFYVHSQNPIGAENIRSYLTNFGFVESK